MRLQTLKAFEAGGNTRDLIFWHFAQHNYYHSFGWLRRSLPKLSLVFGRREVVVEADTPSFAL